MFSANNRSGGRSRLDCLQAPRQRSLSMVGVGLHSRDSYGSIRRASSEERKSGGSVRRGAGDRWSGVGISLGNEVKGAVKDTRQLTDKAYQREKTAELLEFLTENEFKPQVTQSKLLQPSKKEYEVIFTFLVNAWDPTFEVKNLEIDAPLVLKSLGYPFIPNKSVFTYVARTSYSSLLGILVFLLDLAKFALNIDLSKLLESGDSERPEEHAIMLNYMFDCYRSGDDNEDDHIKVFEEIIRKRTTDNLPELRRENEAKKEKLRKVQEELATIEHLEKRSDDQDFTIKQYEEYFVEMDKWKEDKDLIISNLTEELNKKKAILSELEKKVSQKQALYDAQGFDGKKHLSYYEEQKKELNETLERRKAALRDLQNECWQLEIQHAAVVDKGTAVCEELNKMYEQLKDTTDTVSRDLQNIKDTEVQNVSNSFKLEFPSVSFTHVNQLALNTHKESLECIQKKVDTTNMILKTILSTNSQLLTEIQMKKSQISTKLKCVSFEEAKKEQDKANLQKQAIEEVEALETKCGEELKHLKKLRQENDEKCEHLKKLKSDHQEIEKMKVEKQLMLEKYLKEQKIYLEQLTNNAEFVSKMTEDCKKEIYETLKELCKIGE